VPQEANPEAANALLKLLEEPPAGALFVLTTVDPRQVLPTIRSRAVPLRLGRLTDDEVRDFVTEHLGTVPMTRASGSIGDAIGAHDEAESGGAYRAARELLDGVLGGPAVYLERALRQPAFAARGEFGAMLDALADTLGDAARRILGQPVRRAVPEALLRHPTPAPILRALEHVAAAREAAWGNVNPQILLAVLAEDLAEVL
jgi:DNA polymerase-3 subunit delta'